MYGRRVAKLTSILDVAKAMIAERDLDALLRIIVGEAAEVVDADRCSLFLVDRDRRVLWSKIAQGMIGGEEIRVPLDKGIAGWVATSGEVINLPDAYADPRFHREVDQATGYRTRALLCVPMRNTRGEVVGVLQALNNRSGGAFSDEDAELLEVLGGQAAGAVENALLHDEIQRLFEGFVKAAVVAIESRDPSTAGHSERVAHLTLGLADAVEQGGRGPWAGIRFTGDQRMEIRYAALLHDFGKVGVREHVLVKANKLYPEERRTLEQRVAYARKSIEADSLKRRLDILLRGGAKADLEREELACAQQIAALDEAWEFVLRCNKPTVLPAGGFERLAEIAQRTFPGVAGTPEPLLTPDEVRVLSIPQGSLSPEERQEIESHVEHTFRFLSQIPWTRGLRGVPHIAGAHHEKLDGSGYPNRLRPDEIGVEARMMAIADIYDALTASDRPYKKAVPHQMALTILGDEVKSMKLDGHLYELFVEADIAARVHAPARAR
ncbi:HD domain-containing phosphohydrolase [Vulgatibacter sp.]|uniref:HD domain-containing phosphohydrolase n=1 Tax=Vulgatibacter sp. TaxID=1971226 RepID=UPI003565C87D